MAFMTQSFHSLFWNNFVIIYGFVMFLEVAAGSQALVFFARASDQQEYAIKLYCKSFRRRQTAIVFAPFLLSDANNMAESFFHDSYWPNKIGHHENISRPLFSSPGNSLFNKNNTLTFRIVH